MSKKKKEKITYIDDGRTIADMSSIKGGLEMSKKHTHTDVRGVLRTYWSATKMMFLPTLAAVGFLLAAFLIVSLIFWIM